MQIEPTIKQHLRELEERLVQPEVRHSPEEVASLLADEFVEFGSSGRIYDKAEIIAELAAESSLSWSLTDFKVLSIADGVVLVTYRAEARLGSEEQPKSSLRSSIWKMIDGRWQMVFHQGTVVKEL